LLVAIPALDGYVVMRLHQLAGRIIHCSPSAVRLSVRLMRASNSRTKSVRKTLLLALNSERTELGISARRDVW